MFGLTNYYENLRRLSNAISLWLGIQPPDLFFYAFLPPLLVDAALRLNFFVFQKAGGRGGHMHVCLCVCVCVLGGGPCHWMRRRVGCAPRRRQGHAGTARRANPGAPYPPTYPPTLLSLPLPHTQISIHIILMAYGMVILNAIALSAFVLFVMGFQSRQGVGWGAVGGWGVPRAGKGGIRFSCSTCCDGCGGGVGGGWVGG